MSRRLAAAALVLALAGCVEERSPKPDGTPGSVECEEFTRRTMRDGKPVECRMIYCLHWRSGSGGPAVLWCDTPSGGGR